MKVAFGCDHAAIDLKNVLMENLKEMHCMRIKMDIYN